MLIPPTCFTCGRQISHIWFNYNDLVETYKKNVTKSDWIDSKIPKVEKDRLTNMNKQKMLTPEFKALAKLKIYRQCCRRMFICHQDLYEKIY